MKKKILFVYPEMMMGGSTTSLINLLNEFNYEKYEVDIVFRKKRGDLLKYIPKEVNILPSLDTYPENKIGKLLKIFVLLFRKNFYSAMIQKLKKNKTAVQQIFAYNQVIFCKKLKKKYDVAISFLEGFSNAYVNSKKVKADKKINWIHIDYKKAGFNIRYDLKTLRKSDYIAFVSQICLEHFKEVAPELSDKLRVVENVISPNLTKQKAKAFEAENIFPVEKNCLKFLTVCRLSTQTKGLDRILNIIRGLRNKGYDFIWCIIGGNPDSEFTELYKNFEYKENLLLLGEKVNPFPYYKFFDAFILSSRFEGKPMVVTEAQILGLPVICTRYSSAHEQIDNNLDGIIVDNSESALYNQIEALLLDKSFLDNMKVYLSKKEHSIQKQLSEVEVIID